MPAYLLLAGDWKRMVQAIEGDAGPAKLIALEEAKAAGKKPATGQE